MIQYNYKWTSLKAFYDHTDFLTTLILAGRATLLSFPDCSKNYTILRGNP